MPQGLETLPFIRAEEVYLTMIAAAYDNSALLPENSLFNIFSQIFNAEGSQRRSSRRRVQIKPICHVIYEYIFFLQADTDIASGYALREIQW